MPRPKLIDVDPRTLHLPPTRRSGADPIKLQLQIAKYGRSTLGMPPPPASQGTDGALMLTDGVTRATRVAKLLPGVPITVQVFDDMACPVGHLPTVGDKLP